MNPVSATHNCKLLLPHPVCVALFNIGFISVLHEHEKHLANQPLIAGFLLM